jgi:WD40 repeat protein
MSKKPFVIAVSSTFLKVWNIQSGEEEFSYEEIKSSRNQCLVSICSTPDERYLIYGDNKKKMTVWDMSSWQKIAFLVPPMDGYKKTPFLIGYTPNWYSPVAVTPDGQYAISGGHDGSLIVWHVHSGVVLKFLRGNTKNEATAIAVSPDGKYLASAHYDDLIFWDLETHRELATFKEHRGTIMSLSFSCDARYVISVGDRTVIIWDLIKRANVGVFRTQGEISAFASFGFQRFVFGYNTGQVCILQLEGVK